MRAKTKKAEKTARPSLKSAWGRVLDLVQKNRVFLLTTHVNPDGDGLGAESALYCALKSLGKKVLVVNHDLLPPRFSYLPFAPAYRVSDTIPPHDVCFVMDAGVFTRIREDVRREEFQTLVNIDHHYSNDRYGDVNLVDPGACSTGEIVCHLIQALGVPLDKGIAESVYTSLATDTGGFRYPNTTPQVLRLAADLMEAGADGARISEKISRALAPKPWKWSGSPWPASRPTTAAASEPSSFPTSSWPPRAPRTRIRKTWSISSERWKACRSPCSSRKSPTAKSSFPLGPRPTPT